MKNAILTCVLAASCATFAETAEVRLIRTVGGKRVTETKTALLERLDGATYRFSWAKEDIPEDALRLEVVPEFMRAEVGDGGWWFQGRGVWGGFKPQVGTNFWTQQ